MLRQTNKLTAVVLSAVLGVSVLVGVVPARAAGAAQLQISPSSGTLNVGDALNVTINVATSPAEPVDSVEVYINYDASRLQFQSISGSGSALAGVLTGTGGDGEVHIFRFIDVTASQTPVTGIGKIVSVNFKTLAAGSASLSFGASSLVLSNSENVWNGNTAGGTYTIQAPSGGGGGGGGSGGTGSGSGDSGSGSGGTGSGSGGSGSGSGGSSNEGEGTPAEEDTVVPIDPEAETVGYMVGILVLDSAGKPLRDAEITLADKTSKTDANGRGSFLNIPAGEHTVTVAGMSETILVADGDPATVQEFEIKQPGGGFKLPKWALPAGLGLTGLAVLGLVITRVFRARGLSKFETPAAVSSHGAVVGTDAAKPPVPPAPPAAAAPGNLTEPTVIRPSEPVAPETPAAEPEKPSEPPAPPAASGQA